MRQAGRAVSLGLVAWALLACQQNEVAAPPPAVGPASASTRWAPVVPAGDATLLQAPAVLVAPATASGEVRPPLPARVEAVHVQVGQVVAAGDPVVTVVVPELVRAAADRAAAGRLAGLYGRRARELSKLKRDGLARSAELFEVEAQAAEARADRARAEALLRSAGVDVEADEEASQAAGLVLRSPVAGVVTALDAHLGARRGPDDGPLARIEGAAPVRVEARFATLPPAGADVAFVEADGTRHALNAVPTATMASAGDGVIVAWLEPMAPLVRTDGVRGRVVVTAPPGTVLQVPARALLVDGGQAYVFRRTEGGPERVAVEVVAVSGASALVRGPLAAGDAVASDAALVGSEEGGDT